MLSTNLPPNVTFNGYSQTKSGKQVTSWKVCCISCNYSRIVKRADHAKGHANKPCKKCSNKNNNPQGSYNGLRVSHVNKYKIHALSRSKKWEVDIDYLAELAKKQNFKCAFTKQDLVFEGNFSDITASLDRIDNKMGYVVGNVQWVHKKINMMRGQLTVDDFFNMCNMVVNGVKW